MIDIGAGTMDVLYYDTEAELPYKAVVESPVRSLAEKAAGLSGNLLVLGDEMGGGPITQILLKRAREAEVVMSTSAAATLNHDLEKVKSWGIKLIEDDRVEELRHNKNYTLITLGDLESQRLAQIVESFGVPFAFDAVAICAQDHGVPPPGVSHLDFRHNPVSGISGRSSVPAWTALPVRRYTACHEPPAIDCQERLKIAGC